MRKRKSVPFVRRSDLGKALAFLVTKGHTLRELSQCTYGQIQFYLAAYEYEAQEKEKAQKRAMRKSKMRR